MPKKRKGSQNPCKLIKLPYKSSDGEKAIELYEKTGRTAQRWQVLLIRHILAKNKRNQYVHTKFGYAVPRRNGKNEVVAIREMYGLKNGEHILHTAHRTTTTHAAWERLYKLLEKAGIEIEGTYRAYGKEHIYLVDGGRIEFRTRTSKGGLGEGFDLLIIDEAQEYQTDQESSLKYVVSDADNPQTIFCGTPPTPISSGTVFRDYREACLAGTAKNSGWAEWSVDSMSDPEDKELWYRTNPSLGTILTERKIEDEIGKDEVDFNIQRLGLWIKYNLKSVISEREWNSIKVDVVPKLKSKLVIGVKYAQDAATVAVAVSSRTEDGRIYVEVIRCQSTKSGDDWIIEFLKSTAAQTRKVIIDGASGQQGLEMRMKKEGLKKPYLPTVANIIMANSMLEPAIMAKSICHSGQPGLTQAASNCEHRAIGSRGGYGYRAIKDGVDITILESAIIAIWGQEEFKENQIRQRVD